MAREGPRCHGRRGSVSLGYDARKQTNEIASCKPPIRGSSPMMGESRAVKEPALTVRELTVRFAGITALDAVSVQAERGEVLGIIGPNGAGKTTLFNVICGFVRPHAGTVE